MLVSAEMTAQNAREIIGMLNSLTKLRCTGDLLSAFRKIFGVSVRQILDHQRPFVGKTVPLATVLSRLCCQYEFRATSW